MQLVVFGAGNIGRSFIAQLFSRAGYRVVFVDIDEELIAALNREGRYRIEIRDRTPGEIWVEGVSAIPARAGEEVARAVAAADIVATAVGAAALPQIYSNIAAGLVLRRDSGEAPLDIIICENLRNAAEIFAEGLRKHLPPDFPLEACVGLVETSIGKMVPIMPEEVRRRDPLLLYAEAYNTLILDAKGFKNPIPAVPGLDPKENMAAHVDRKAFIHNLGHAACAYLGYLANPQARYIWEVVADGRVCEAARRAMWESAAALLRRYPDEFDEENQQAHIEDLLARFGNKDLGDTVYRVGRDLPRKLGRDDRLVGALLMDAEHGVEAPITALCVAAGFLFRGTDERGQAFPPDREFAEHLGRGGLDWALARICGLNEAAGDEGAIAGHIRRAHQYLTRRAADWLETILACPASLLR